VLAAFFSAMDRDDNKSSAIRVSRPKFRHFTAGAAALSAVSRVVRAQAYPMRPITMIVPQAAGGTRDIVRRMLPSG
jgi:hypothetical protein